MSHGPLANEGASPQFSVEVRCLAGAAELGANAYLVCGQGWQVLLDAGASSASHRGWLTALDRAPDAIVLSHVHADHIGALPAILSRFPDTRVLLSEASRALLPLVLRREKRALTAVSLDRCEPLSPLSPLTLIARPGLTLTLTAYPCGHVLGAIAMVLEVTQQEKFRSICYLPDFSAHDQELVPRASLPVFSDPPLDLLLMEGVLATDKPSDALDYDASLEAAVEALLTHRGPRLLAVASLGESSELACALARGAMSRGVREPLIVHDFLAPLFEIHGRFSEQLNGDGAWLERLKFASQRECAELLRAGRLVIAPGEHLDEGTPAHQLGRPLWGEASARIVLCNGVRRKSVAGALLRAAEGGGKLAMGGGEAVSLRATIQHVLIPNHAPRWELLGAIAALKPRQVALVHGDRGPLERLAKVARKRHEVEVLVPQRGDRIAL